MSIDDGVIAGSKVADVARLAAPVVAELGPAVATLGRQVLQVPVTGLDALAQALVVTTAEIGQPPSPRPFSGHITLARHRGRGSLQDLAGEAVSGRWTVDEIALVASVASGHPGVPNRYETVANFPLKG